MRRRLSLYEPLKRTADALVAAVALVVTVPVQLAVGVAVHRQLGRPVLFRQPRPGKDGRIFTLYKFRSMRDLEPGHEAASDADRLTPFGEWLRRTSLDELPTLWNVLRGDMSLVGPRPLLVEYLPHYTAEQARRHEVRPGLTGLAQVSGRNQVDWDERFAWDVHYVRARGLRLDLAIVLRTVRVVLAREGISAPGHATMPPFVTSTAAVGPHR